MKSWLDSNPSRRKTKKGILRFVNGWLSKEQDKGRVEHSKPVKDNNNFEHRRYSADMLAALQDN